MDSNAELKLFTREVGFQPLLYLYGTLDGINGARKFGQDAIPRRIGGPPAMLGNKAVHHLPMSH